MTARGVVLDQRQIVDDFRLLEIDPGAPACEIKRAFRRLIKIWHPDVSDQPVEIAVRTTHRLYQAFHRVRSLSARDLELVRGYGAGSAAPDAWYRRGRDVVGDLTVTRQQARLGCRWRLRIATCYRCAGWGAAAGGELRRCAACDGLGRHRLRGGGWDLDARCTACQGHGCAIDEPCGACGAGGTGGTYDAPFLMPGFTPVEVAYRRVAGLGHPGLGGAPAGDLFLRIITPDAARSASGGSARRFAEGAERSRRGAQR
jgi:molecular chaperone DnaJ